jgi:hypothetical protein
MDNRLQVVSLGLDNTIRLWDGMLREDWLETKMQQNDNEFCSFEEVTAGVLTWNAGAVKPNHLKGSERDAAFFKDYFSSHTPPDILVFGFQELVDLENKKVTASKYTRFCSALAATTNYMYRELFQEQKEGPHRARAHVASIQSLARSSY